MAKKQSNPRKSSKAPAKASKKAQGQSGAIRRGQRGAATRRKQGKKAKASGRKRASTKQLQAAFLKALCGEARGNKTEAARIAGIDRDTHYTWRNNDPEYAELFEEMTGRLGDLIEENTIQVALDGWVKKIFYEGEEVGEQREFQPKMVELLLKRFKPEEYRERMDVTSAGRAIQVDLAYRGPDGEVRRPGKEPLR